MLVWMHCECLAVSILTLLANLEALTPAGTCGEAFCRAVQSSGFQTRVRDSPGRDWIFFWYLLIDAQTCLSFTTWSVIYRKQSILGIDYGRLHHGVAGQHSHSVQPLFSAEWLCMHCETAQKFGWKHKREGTRRCATHFAFLPAAQPNQNQIPTPICLAAAVVSAGYSTVMNEDSGEKHFQSTCSTLCLTRLSPFLFRKCTVGNCRMF